MCMPAHLEDTLFLFFESDVRFWKEDCIAPELWLRLAVQSCREPLASITGVDVKEEVEEEGEPASSSTARASRLAGPDTLPQPQLRPDADSQGRFISMEAIWKPWQEGYQTVSTELVELVQCATRASRLAHGDLIWFGYNCGDEKQKGPNDKIAFGSQGIMFTMRAAKRLHTRMQGVTPQHFDLWLKEVLLEQSTQPSLSPATIRACYVVPPLGGFQTHNTGCRGDFGVRTGLWDEPWSSPGGMRDHRASRRRLARFSKSRNPAEYHLETLKFPVVTARHHWLTALPPTHPPGDGTLQRLIAEWSLLGPLGQWVGPPYSESEWAIWHRCRASRRQRGYPSTALERVRKSPWDEYPYHESQRKFCMVKQSNFQRWIATVSEAPIEPLADGTHVPQRAKRIERDWASLNDKRFFCDFDDPEALRCLQSMRLLCCCVVFCSWLLVVPEPLAW